MRHKIRATQITREFVRYKIRATQITREFVRYTIRATKKYKRVNEV